jgi:hypothetical protein
VPFLREVAFFMSTRRRSLNCPWEHLKHFFLQGTIMFLRRRRSNCPEEKFKFVSQKHDGNGT